MDEPNERYSYTAMGLHWLLALALLCTFCVGLYMADLKLSLLRIRLFNWHKWAGISILLLSGLRLAWRWSHRPPPVPAQMDRLKKLAAEWVHRLLYLFFFLVPLAGWAYSNAAGFPVVWFGQLPLPDLVGKNKELADILQDVHAALAFGLAGLAVLHVGAALHHHFILRDGLITRMLPLRRRS